MATTRHYMTLPGLAAKMKLVPAAVEAAAQLGLAKGARASVPLMRRRTRAAPPASAHGDVGAVATERYLWNWQSEALTPGARVFNDMPYSGVIELGLRRGEERPPEANLVRWLAFRYGYDSAAPRTWKIARAICLNIYRRGLRPRRVMIRAVPAVADIALAHVVREIERALAAL